MADRGFQRQAGRDEHIEDSWAAIDSYTLSNLHPSSKPNVQPLAAALESCTANGLPPIYVNPTYGKFLALQCRLLKVKHALEVGTLGGYSAIWLATENPELKISTIEYNPHHAKVSRENIERAGVADRVTVHEGAGVDVLPRLLAEVESGKLPQIGFAFVDADKINNWTYFDFAVKMAYPGACIVVDNMVARGKLADEPFDPEDYRVSGARKVIEEAGKDPRVDAMVMQTVGLKGYDGFLMATVL